MKKLVIVSGASGSLGNAYVRHYENQPETLCVALTRRAIESEKARVVVLDLLDTASVSESIQGLDLSSTQEIILIHPVGKFKFEEQGKPEVDDDADGIDDEVYNSNIITFENIVNPLIDNVKREKHPIAITVSAFGSISDRYIVKYWQSYSKAKNILRDRMRVLAERSDVSIRSVFFEVSTANTDKERELRPFADTTYWLLADEIVAQSVPLLDDSKSWSEISIFKPMPTFESGYYQDTFKIRDKWSEEMGRELE